MVDVPTDVEADGREEFGALCKGEFLRLAVFLRSLARGTGLSDDDLNEILQESIVKALCAVAQPGHSLKHPKAYFYQITVNGFRNYLRHRKHRPMSLPSEGLEFVDSRVVPPDKSIEMSDAWERTEQRTEAARLWAERFVGLLQALQDHLSERNCLIESLSPPHADRRTACSTRRRGRPTRDEQVHQLILQLPGFISLVTDYLREVSTSHGET